MRIDLGDRYVSRGCLFDSCDPYGSAVFREHLKTGDVFLDIGANVRLDTVLAGTIIGETGSIFAFETLILGPALSIVP